MMHKVRVGIMTFWWTHSNYGQVLQAYALMTFLKNLGYDVFFIRYQGIGDIKKKSILKRLLTFNLKAFVNRRIISYKLAKESKLTPRRFEDFKAKYLTYSAEQYASLKELQNNPPIADVYIAGSDQVWNNTFSPSCEPYLLGFGDENIKRIAYAASFGQKRLSDTTKDLFIRNIGRFDAVSVREFSGLEICKDVGCDNAIWLPDPTFLLDKAIWSSLYQSSSPVMNNVSSIFIYTLGNSLIKNRSKYIDHVSSLPNVTISHVSSNYDFSGNSFPTIEEWLKLIDDSQFVITNSFHGMVFSIILNRNFVILPNTGAATGMNERITSLLEKLQLEDNMMSDYDSEKLNLLMKKQIDWEFVNKSISIWRSEAEAFLIESLPAPKAPLV
ncbi:polysaccharide pyruvyl transferase [Arcticibacter pallidicorallinus]|uniref:Polysaccharide pyruvyl transferase n=1 Tax=Arcticibacter pallidicorallinus TaxID=1259464 RepID=A0A2T0UBN6_9SPHI|nr:polysaccharide pyruvyl transferase family protein [Arcticibacter pallidicorallinus]PRY55288.1 polysaccharide pyruvyl transferase [Arcticibacter pallidicorallinus]